MPLANFEKHVTSGSTITLTVDSAQNHYFSGSSNQVVVLPVVSTLEEGFDYFFVNASSADVTVNSSGSNLVALVNAGTSVRIVCTAITGTSAASWGVELAFTQILVGTIRPIQSGNALYLDLSAGADKLAFIKGDGSGEMILDIGVLSSARVWSVLDSDGTIALTDGELPAGIIPTPNSAGVLIDSGFQSVIGAANWFAADASDAEISGVVTSVDHPATGTYNVNFPDFGDTLLGAVATVNDTHGDPYTITAFPIFSTQLQINTKLFNAGILGLTLPSFIATDIGASVLIFRIAL